MKLFKLTRLGTAILISVFVFMLLLVTAKDIGLTWDEPAYIAAARSYMGWYGQVFTNPKEAFREEVITKAWEINHEHPPLDKIWSGAVWTLARNFTNDLTAHRMGNMLLVAALAGFLYLLIRDAYGCRVTYHAAFFLSCTPLRIGCPGGGFSFRCHICFLENS
jgi:4-amino-4-deoxy-L-arabinose transferase-like glycosyltransferase